MISKPTARFERFFLTPISFLLPVLGLVSFFDRIWFVGVYFILAWAGNAVLGQSLHPNKTVEQLKQGGLSAESNIREDGLIPEDEYKRLAQAIFFFALMLRVTTSILLCHFQFRWFVSIPTGLAVWVVGVFGISAISVWQRK
jgi:hypothetical protein